MMKNLEEMTYFELLDLIAWCEEKEESLGDKKNPYTKLREMAREQLKITSTQRALEQFWWEKERKNYINTILGRNEKQGE